MFFQWGTTVAVSECVFSHVCCAPDKATASGCSPRSGLTVQGKATEQNCTCVCVLSDDETWVEFSSGLLPTHQKTPKTCCLYDKHHTHSDPNCCLSPAGRENRLPEGIALSLTHFLPPLLILLNSLSSLALPFAPYCISLHISSLLVSLLCFSGLFYLNILLL